MESAGAGEEQRREARGMRPVAFTWKLRGRGWAIGCEQWRLNAELSWAPRAGSPSCLVWTCVLTSGSHLRPGRGVRLLPRVPAAAGMRELREEGVASGLHRGELRTRGVGSALGPAGRALATSRHASNACRQPRDNRCSQASSPPSPWERGAQAGGRSGESRTRALTWRRSMSKSAPLCGTYASSATGDRPERSE